MNILALQYPDSGKLSTDVPDVDTGIDWLVYLARYSQQCQAQSHFVVRSRLDIVENTEIMVGPNQSFYCGTLRPDCRPFRTGIFNWSEELKLACSDWIRDYLPNTLTFIDVDDKEFHIFKPWRNFYQANYPLLAHKYLPDEVDKILYLDTDTLVLKDIAEFYSTDFDDTFLIAAEEQCDKKYSRFLENPEKQTGEASIFNSGVLLMNLTRFRAEKIDTDFYLDHINRMEGAPYFADQGLLNYIFGGGRQVKLVPAYKYNHTVYQEIVFGRIFSYTKEERAEKFNDNYTEDFDAENSGAIIHFTYTKPWDVIARNGDIVKGKFRKMNFYRLYRELCDTVGIDPNEDITPYVKCYYAAWWDIARKLPLPYYEQLLTDAFDTAVRKPLSENLSWFQNAAGFAKSVIFDHFENRNLEKFLEACSSENRTVAILKAKDMAGQILIKAMKSYGIKIILESPHYGLEQLSKEEFEICRQADIVISADVHSNSPIVKDDVQAIRDKDLLK